MEAAVRLTPKVEALPFQTHLPQQKALNNPHPPLPPPSPSCVPPSLQDFVTVLEQCGAGSVSFNPITGPNITKALTAIAEAERYSLEQHLAAGLVEGAAGDLRNAIQNLQLLLQGPGVAKINKAKDKGKVSGAVGLLGFAGCELGVSIWTEHPSR